MAPAGASIKLFSSIMLLAALLDSPVQAQPKSADESRLLSATPATTGTVTVGTVTARPTGHSTKTLLSTEGEISTQPIELVSGQYAVFHTSDGDFVVSLLSKQAPKAVQNFTDLATGKKRWKHPITMAETDRPVYNNTSIYRTIEDSMIFGGDPINKGQGDTGTLLDIEPAPDVKFDKAGMLAMDNNGSKASSSRFFITLRPFPDRSGNYTIFGQVAGGLDVVRIISNKPTKKPQVPLEPTLLSSVEIIQIPFGKKTTAMFATEDGRRVLSVSSEFTDIAPPEEPKVADLLTTATAKETTGTDAATTDTSTTKSL